MRQEIKIAGVMTGTSCDGLDVACAGFEGEGWRPLWTHSAPYPARLRERVLAAQKPGAELSLRAWGELHRDLGEWMGAVLAKALRGRPAAEMPEAIGSHGQTVAHYPAARKAGFTTQLGDPTRIVEATELTVVSNFRDGDMAAGGEGAPLAPRFHRLIARGFPGGAEGVAIHNLGGISNLTYLGPKGATIAFDTGPANLWIDAAAELATQGKARMDRGGALAAGAEPDFVAMEAILRDPFFHRAPPKSTGRDEFPFARLLGATRARGAVLAATATAITVESIGRAYEAFIVRRGLPLRAIYFCGGGARNRFLMQSLRRRLSGIEVAPLDEMGVDSKFLEAQAFAYFAHLALRGEALGGPWTGGEGAAAGAHIIPGRNWRQIVQRLADEGRGGG